MSELVISVSDGVATLTQFSGGPRRREVVRRAAFALEPDGGPSQIAGRLAGLAGQIGMEGEAPRLSVDGARLLVREFSFPFTQAAKIQRAVGFELESGLPCPVEELVSDVLVFPARTGCRVFSLSLRREDAARLLQALRESGRDPECLGVDLASLAQFARQMPVPRAPLCLLDVGFGRSLMVLRSEDGVCGLARREAGVGAVLGAMGQGGMERQEFLDGAASGAEIPAEPLEAAAREVERTVRQNALACGLMPESILLCGAGASLPGFAEALSRAAGVPVHGLWDALSPEDLGLDAQADPLVVGMLPGRDLVGRVRPVNFRQGSLARKTSVRGALRRLAWAGAVALMLCVGLGASWAAHTADELRAARAGSQRFEQVFHQTLPDAEGDFSRTQMLSILKTRVAQLRGREDKGSQRPQTRAIDILNAVSAKTPPELRLTVDAVTIGLEGGKLLGTAPDYQSVNRFLETVAASGAVSDARIVVASTQQQTGEVRFEIEFARN